MVDPSPWVRDGEVRVATTEPYPSLRAAVQPSVRCERENQVRAVVAVVEGRARSRGEDGSSRRTPYSSRSTNANKSVGISTMRSVKCPFVTASLPLLPMLTWPLRTDVSHLSSWKCAQSLRKPFYLSCGRPGWAIYCYWSGRPAEPQWAVLRAGRAWDRGTLTHTGRAPPRHAPPLRPFASPPPDGAGSRVLPWSCPALLLPCAQATQGAEAAEALSAA